MHPGQGGAGRVRKVQGCRRWTPASLSGSRAEQGKESGLLPGPLVTDGREGPSASSQAVSAVSEPLPNKDRKEGVRPQCQQFCFHVDLTHVQTGQTPQMHLGTP